MDKKIKVLIIEDAEDDVILLVNEIKNAGLDIEYECVDEEEDVRNMLETGKWDIICSDYMMPRLTGMKVLEIVKEKGIDVPLIIISGTIGEDVAVEAMRQGANDYLMKDNLMRLPSAIKREIKEAEIRHRAREAHKKLEESEERYRALVECAAEGIVVARLEDRKFHFANDTFCGMLGYTYSELMDMRVEDIHPEGSIEFVMQEFEMQVRGEKVTSREIPCLRKDGTIIWATVNAKKVKLNDTECLVGFFTDITLNKKIKDENAKYIKDLEVFREVAVDRENMMIKLKMEINELSKQLGSDPPYDLGYLND